MPADKLVRIGELARRADVPVATVKFYVREGLIRPARKSGRTMAWYEPDLAARIRTIKDLQRDHYLPLEVIRDALDRDRDQPDELAAAEAIAGVLARHAGPRSRTRAELLERGSSARELDWLAAVGLVRPTGPDARYQGDDLALLTTLGAARKAGLAVEMLPFEILQDYLVAIRALVDVELRMFRDGVIRRASSGDVARLTTAATRLSERLVVLIRRKLLLPTLHHLIEEDARDPTPPAVDRARRGVRRQPGPHRRRGPRRERARR